MIGELVNMTTSGQEIEQQSQQPLQLTTQSSNHTPLLMTTLASVTGELMENNVTFTELSPVIPVYMRVVGFILCFIITTIGFFGNLTVVVSVLRYSFLQTPANIVIASMACVDMSYVIGIIWLDLMVYCLGYWPFQQREMCLYQVYFLIYATELLIFHIFIVTLFRYLSIVFPRVHNHIKGVLAWIISFIVLYIAPLVLFLQTSYRGMNIGFKYGLILFYNTRTMACNTMIPNVTRRTSFAWMLIPTVFGTASSLLYAHIYYVHYRSRRQVSHSLANSNSKKKHMTEALQLMKIMLLIMGIFLVTQLIPPIMQTFIYRGYQFPWIIGQIPALLLWIRISINWLIYGALNVNFRIAYKKMLNAHTNVFGAFSTHASNTGNDGIQISTV